MIRAKFRAVATMDNIMEEDAPLVLADHMLTSVQFTTLASHMLLANLIDSPLYLHYSVYDPDECCICMAIRKGGKALLAVFIGNDNRIHLVELQADEEKGDLFKRRHIFTLSGPEATEDCWEEIEQQLHDWTLGAREKIVIGEKDIDTLQQ
jgi:hypothetical protein